MNIRIVTGDGSEHMINGAQKVSYDSVHDELRVEVVSEGVKATVFSERIGEIDAFEITDD